MPESRTLTNKQLTGIHVGLAALGNRKMALISGDLKVARLLKVVAPLSEPLGPAKQRAASEVLDKYEVHSDSLTQTQILKINTEIKLAQDAIDQEPVEVEFPEIRIKEEDLPKEQKGEDGWKNASGLGAIIADLDFLFEFKE